MCHNEIRIQEITDESNTEWLLGPIFQTINEGKIYATINTLA